MDIAICKGHQLTPLAPDRCPFFYFSALSLLHNSRPIYQVEVEERGRTAKEIGKRCHFSTKHILNTTGILSICCVPPPHSSHASVYLSTTSARLSDGWLDRAMVPSLASISDKETLRSLAHLQCQNMSARGYGTQRRRTNLGNATSQLRETRTTARAKEVVDL